MPHKKSISASEGNSVSNDTPLAWLVGSRTPHGSRIASVLLLFLLILVGVELALQVRSHVRYGQSIFNVLTEETRYVLDPATGLRLLRPNRTFSGSESIVRTNSLGLRGPELPVVPARGTLRIAVIGASTVMGAYARDNDQ